MPPASWLDLVAVHLDFFVGEKYNARAMSQVGARLRERAAGAGAIVAGDLGSHPYKLSEAARHLHLHEGFRDPASGAGTFTCACR